MTHRPNRPRILVLSMAALLTVQPFVANAATKYQFQRAASGLVVQPPATAGGSGDLGSGGTAGTGGGTTSGSGNTGSTSGVTSSTDAIAFGNVNVGTTSSAQSVILTNTGNTNLSISSISVSGPFNATQNCGAPWANLAASASCTVNVTYAPTAMGASTGSLSMVTGAGTKTVALSGTGLLTAGALSITTLSFGDVGTNTTSAPQTVELSNIGNTVLDVSPVVLSAPWAVTTTCAAQLPVNSTCTYSVTYSPTTIGASSVTMSLVTSGGTYPVALVGSGFSVAGQTAYTTPGTYSWIAPASVTSVSVVAVGAGSVGGGGLGWKNNIPVVPGQAYTVVVGAAPGGNISPYAAGSSYFINATTVAGNGSAGYAGGTFVGDGGGNGGGGNKSGGGAGGYAGNGAAGVTSSGSVSGVAAPVGGGGGSGGIYNGYPHGGGGVGLFGQGLSGIAGTSTTGGGGGSGGADGTAPPYAGGRGGAYGGGGTCVSSMCGYGASGAVRIIWGGSRAFPSTNTGDM